MAKRSLDFSSVVTQEGKWYVATSPELGVMGKNAIRVRRSRLENVH